MCILNLPLLLEKGQIFLFIVVASRQQNPDVLEAQCVLAKNENNNSSNID